MDARYFAFGSNMGCHRLQARIAAARPWGRGQLSGWRFVCNKIGLDGSAKANIVRCPGALVWGAIYQLPTGELGRLDVIEGGYDRIVVDVGDDGGELWRCQTYVSHRISDDHTPFDWYRALMIDGAREHGLPADHIAVLEGLAARPDPRR